ncbi:MAG: DegV family protein [Enterocloster asparagiformis]|nr:DegV family protein [Enterocloster asparagiformis]
MEKIILTTESGSDVPQAMADELGIRIAPMHVILGSESYPDRSIPVADVFAFFKRTKQMPTTSAVNPQEYAVFFLKLREENPDAEIIHIAYSSKASCTYQNAKIALDDLKDRRIRLIDSETVSSGIALLLWKSAQVIKSARSADQAEEMIRGLIRRERVSFLPDTLEYLRAGGRVSNAAYLGTSLLRLKVLINMVDGKLVASKKYRGDMEKVSFQYLEGFVKTHSPSREAIFLFYAEGFSMALLERLQNRCRQMGFEQVLTADIGCVISCHGGPGVMGLAAFAGEA